MSYVNEYIQTFAGEAAHSLLRCMAVANGNKSLDNIILTQSEATRNIVTYSQNASISDYNNWEMLMDEIYYDLNAIKSDPNSTRRYICRLMMKLRIPASYFHTTRDNANEKAINAFFACIMNSIQKAYTMLEAVGYIKIPLGEYNRKWEKQSFHDICTIGNSLERLGNIIQWKQNGELIPGTPRKVQLNDSNDIEILLEKWFSSEYLQEIHNLINDFDLTPVTEEWLI